MLYKSSLLAVNIVLFSIANAIASEIPKAPVDRQTESISDVTSIQKSISTVPNLDLESTQSWKMRSVSPLSDSVPIDNRLIAQTGTSSWQIGSPPSRVISNAYLNNWSGAEII